MAADDYDVIVYKVLLYLYGCMKRKIVFDETVFYAEINKKMIADEYFADVLYFMKSEGLIDNVTIITAWGKTRVVASDLKNMEITVKGIRYLKEDSMMQKIKDNLSGVPGIVAELISLVF